MNPEATLIYNQYIKPMSDTIQKYSELEHSIKELTGFDLSTLKELFAMGYTLKHPDHELSPAQSVRIAEIMYERGV